MHGLAHHVVDAGGEQAQRVVERMTFVEAEHRRVRAFADHPRQALALAAVADQERFDGVHVRFARLADPLAELGRLDAGGRHALPIETGRVAAGHNIAIVNNNVHAPAPKARLDRVNSRTYAYASRRRTQRGRYRHSFKGTIKCLSFDFDIWRT